MGLQIVARPLSHYRHGTSVPCGLRTAQSAQSRCRVGECYAPFVVQPVNSTSLKAPMAVHSSVQSEILIFHSPQHRIVQRLALYIHKLPHCRGKSTIRLQYFALSCSRSGLIWETGRTPCAGIDRLACLNKRPGPEFQDIQSSRTSNQGAQKEKRRA
jgi:hypothetical protein